MTLYRVELREAAAKALVDAATMAGQRVFTACTMPSRPADLPNIYVQSPTDRAESLNRGPPQFVRTGLIVVIARVSAASGPEAEVALDILTEQIELAILTNGPLMRMITQVSSLETGIRVNAETSPVIGEARMDFTMEWIETYPMQSAGAAPVAIAGSMQSGGNSTFAGMNVNSPQS
ncbi:hypothetical protein AA12717_1403 [Gluconacetobacter sacchari DSM 12717]|uniref:Phage protein n=2 Tax=Gluconacetobacter sacchari TaxID=92759 RepID=A0A7W4IBJ7_9PROT|nr:hypothetical protein [Gluconacetobacter sacchari]MBB2159724.1 hypothetical protein [Gluconacetobacter sacchari]GBQ23135.1 hypothetical protein AA12717_1403 [Gluconacetobacter sacchari DSM 12717]